MTLRFLLAAGLALHAQTGKKDPPPKTSPVSAARPRMQSTAMRNENVAINPIDNNAVKEANVRMGTTTTVVAETPVETGYFAAEFGRPAGPASVLAPANKTSAWHAELFESLRNSVFNARAFFQSGPVKPSRQNFYGFRSSGPLGGKTVVTFSGSQRNVRGMVNGNVLVPLPSERVPRAADPAVRALVQRFLDAYPKELPNRPDFDPRALNTNAPQRIDGIEGIARLDRDLGAWGKLSASHQLTREHKNAFQLVAGQNPDSDVHSHLGQLGWRFSPAPATDIAAGFTFSRTRTALLAEPHAVPSRIRIGYLIEELGPDSEFPVHRAANLFRYGVVASHRVPGGRHSLTFGADLARFQLNGIETNSSRGNFNFTNNFGRTGIENLLMGTPAYYEVTVGQFDRGFRNWTGNAFVADRWKIHPRLQIYFGLRYNAVTGPTEVNRLHPQLYACDCNNFSPRFSLAWQMGRGWALRTSYTASFAEIPPVTYQQIRYNQPYVQFIQVQNPGLLRPLAGIDLQDPNLRTSPTILSHDLVSPYTHQYNMTLERKLALGSMLRVGYIGSRSFKALNGYVYNRAIAVAGIPLTLDTVDARRPNPRYYEVRAVVNGGIAYFDAGQASWDLPSYRGLRANISYTFGKAIDEGTDFTSTAANRDMSRSRSQSQYESFHDRKGLSNFDATHAFQLNYFYDLPQSASAPRWVRGVVNNWQFSGISLLKSGTPLTLFIGSDAPGFGNVDGSPSDRPNIVDPAILGMTIGNPDTAPGIMRRDRFAYITPGDLRGNLGRGTFRKSPIHNWNAALSRQWVWGGSREWRAQFRAEAYNLTNTPQFDEPQRNLGSPAFGKITNTLNDGRIFQLGIRIVI